ncbi:hypothetical protein BDQ12DRAFT_728741 [Crucibulum laeve]|uniref:Uncharacterized protein n=1 Tax=Crucibulum laeve TaxID=68775 RepID=A0A5C3LKF3_9AGAR|nr:hypothetical protein BDQ12DRAFT_728741 [Crucibulum laeve]
MSESDNKFLTSPIPSPRSQSPTSSSTTPAADNQDSDPSRRFHEDGTSSSISQQPSLPTTPTCTPEDCTQCKRQADDANQEQLKQFAAMPGHQQSIFLAGLIFQHIERLELIQPPEAPYVLPDSLKAKIEKYTFIVLIDPSLPKYLSDDGPLNLVLDFIQKHLSWGLSSAIMEDPVKLKVIVKAIRDEATNLRNLFKDEVKCSIEHSASDGSLQPAINIVKLCKNIVGICSRIASKVWVSLKMAARFAFVRNEYVAAYAANNSKPGRNFWIRVDQRLERYQKEKNNDEVKISSIFGRILQSDRRIYGSIDVENLLKEPLSMDELERE